MSYFFPRHLWIPILALALTACASLPLSQYPAWPVDLPQRMELASVPFHPQDEYQCGPAALATALGAWGIDASPQALAEQVYLPGRQGSLQPEMLAATRRAGLLPYVLHGDPTALFHEVAVGHPVVVLQNLGATFLPQWHYAVVVGYDAPGDEVILRSGGQKRLVMDKASFLVSWTRAGSWAFVPLPPDQLPARAKEADYLAAAASLERVNPTAARRAYSTALGAWTHSLTALIGLGNTAYRMGDLEGARAAFQEAAYNHPESADAWNNLAQVQQDSGRHREALEAACRAVSLGGARLAIYAATLAAIEAEAEKTSAAP